MEDQFIFGQYYKVMKDSARLLAKRDVNIACWYRQIFPQTKDLKLTEIDLKSRKQLWQCVAIIKQ